MSLGTRAEGSNLFLESVERVEKQVIPNLTTSDKDRMLVLTQLTDLIVPLDTMQIDGVQSHRSLAFGHSGGFLAHFFADRNLITKFAEAALND